MDYEEKIREYMVSSKVDQLYKSMLINLFPELAESEDEKIRKYIVECVEKYGPANAYPERFRKMLAYLKKQGEQKPVEEIKVNNGEISHNLKWSEEDELMLESIIQTLKLTNGAAQIKIDWLKSLRHHKQWKPSEEQMKAFEYCIEYNCCDKDGLNGSKMVELYKQLKAL